MARCCRWLTPALAAMSLGFGPFGSGRAAAPSQQSGIQDQRPVFRLGVDLHTLEVQVIDREGRPISGLGAERFDVSIDGRRRTVAHAELLSPQSIRDPGNPAAGSAANSSANDRDNGRIYVLAVDEYSLRADTLLAARRDMERFVARLQPQDFVGIYAFPNSQLVMAPTRDHVAVRAIIGRLTGSYERLPSQFNLIESEVVGITERDPDIMARVFGRECARGRGSCDGLVAEARALAGQYEAIGAARLGALDSLFESLARSPRLKVVILVSGHLATSTSAIGRPNLQAMTKAVGRRAAAANVALYILYFDTTMTEMSSARERTPRDVPSWEAATHATGLEYIRASSNGYMAKVQAGSSDFVFDRVLRETSAHYLLGIRTEADDRDGKPHFLRVEVRQHGAMVRHPSTTVIPK